MDYNFQKGDWEDLGKSIQNMVDSAIHSRDFQRLSEEVGRAVSQVMEDSGAAIRKAAAARPITASSRVRPTIRRTDMARYYGNPAGKKLKNALKTIIGGFLTFSMGVGFIACLGAWATEWIWNAAGATATATMLALTLASGALLKSGINGNRRLRRFRAYRRTLADKSYCELPRLAAAVGKPVAFVVRDLQTLLLDGMFPEGHLDDENRNLIITDETYRLYLESKGRQTAVEAAKPREKTESAVAEVLRRGNAYLAQIRSCNDRIPGEAVSDKISRVELLVQRIFQRAETHPEIIPDLKKLMDYYLPMTVKLLTAYADMDAQPVQGENIRSAKVEIEATLDTLEAAFEKLLDSVFQDTALDISTDISVLNNLLAQEGLKEDAFSSQLNF